MRKITNRGLISIILTLLQVASAQQPSVVPIAARPKPQKTEAKSRPKARSSQRKAGIAPQVVVPLPGQSRTLLPDGSILNLGGMALTGMVSSALLNGANLSAMLLHARAWHTATVMPDGSVLVLGGLNGQDLVTDAELFSPSTRTFSSIPTATLTARAYHTATLLTDGRLLIAGGIADNGRTINELELWDPQTQTSQFLTAQLAFPRKGHTATLQPDGTVRFEGGLGDNGSPILTTEVFYPNAQTVSVLVPAPQAANLLQMVASIPSDGARDVSLTSPIALRFSRSLDVKTINTATMTVQDQNGPVAAQIIGAEAGMLAFVTVEGGLKPDSTYTVSVHGAQDSAAFSIQPAAFTFSTISAAESSSAAARNGATTDEDPPIPALQARQGATALSGIVRTVTGKYLPGVTLELECGSNKQKPQTTSDATGRFLLETASAGHCELEIDGTTARRGSDRYGIFEPGVDISAGVTNVLPYTIWMTPLDIAHAINIPARTTTEFVVTNPTLPGLELHLPVGATVKDYDGNVVSQLSITRIPLARPPFPLPASVTVPFYFTIQPGGAYIEVNGKPGGAQLYYPNLNRAPAGFKIDFWNYDPDEKGWYVYGTGTVDVNRRYIVPSPTTKLYELTGAMAAGSGKAGNGGAGTGGSKAGDPVDLGTGIFTYQHTDLSVSDVLPVTLTRTYRQWDAVSHAFGIGFINNLDMFLVGDTNPYTYLDLIRPDGSRVHYSRISPGTTFADAVYQQTAEPSLIGSQISWNPLTGWELKQKDDTIWGFRDGYQATLPAQAGLVSVTDRNGNSIKMNRDATTGNLLKAISPNGHYIAFTYDSGNRVTQATDNSGRSVSYHYDVSGRLIQVDDAIGGTYKYTYDANNQMLALTDPRNITFLTNQYDTQGHVTQQTMADGGVWTYTYTQDANGNITQTDVTDPRGKVRRTTFNTSGYFSGGKMTSETYAYGATEHQTYSYSIQSGTNLLQSTTDALGRVTAFTYDAKGNVLTVTKASGTADAVTTTYTYDTHNLVATITDPLTHVASLTRDISGNVTSVTDPLSHQVTFTYNAAGQPLTVTNASGTSTFAYSSGNLVTVTDPLGNTSHRTLDAVGRLVGVTDALGNTSTMLYDAANELLSQVDPLNAQTSFAHDANGNLLTLTDARTNATSYTYDGMDRVLTRTNPLTHADVRTYDLNGNVATYTDRKSQVTTYTYDALNRLTGLLFADSSTVAYTYDAGNRVTQIVDSISGTITRTFDTLGRLTNETTPQGSVSYTYDAVGRRSTMTVAGQTAVSYTYDNANRLTQITQGSAITAFTYDSANRRTSLTFPNGIVASYGYDAASNLTSIAYANGATSLGNLLYTYDSVGRRITTGGSLAATGLPAAISSATYNADNQLTNWNGTTLIYDLNGNMTSDGATTHTWDARNQLAAFGSTSFAYDAFGRRIQNAAGKAFLYDGANTIQELSGGTVMANLLTGLGVDEVLTRTDSAGTGSYLTDALGSTIALANSSGSVQSQYSYEPFGKTTFSGASSTNTFQYTARENDGTGLYYSRARYYNPTLQRYISADPIGFNGGINVYAYVGNRPVDFNDPSGMDWNHDGPPSSGEYLDAIAGSLAKITPPEPDYVKVSASVPFTPLSASATFVGNQIYYGGDYGAPTNSAFSVTGGFIVGPNKDAAGFVNGYSGSVCAFMALGGCATYSAGSGLAREFGFGLPGAGGSVGAATNRLGGQSNTRGSSKSGSADSGGPEAGPGAGHFGGFSGGSSGGSGASSHY